MPTRSRQSQPINGSERQASPRQQALNSYDKLNMHPVFSLRGRVQQRLSGTVGLLLSMSGYTPDTLSQANIGQGPMVLLLDKDHFEAMLFGATSPQKLLKALLDRASFYGEAYTPWSKLVSE